LEKIFGSFLEEKRKRGEVSVNVPAVYDARAAQRAAKRKQTSLCEVLAGFLLF